MTCDDLTVRIVRSIYYEDDVSWNYKSLVYPFNVLYFILDGDGWVTTVGGETPLRHGYAYLIPPYLPHDLRCETFIRKLYVDVYVETMPGDDIFSQCMDVLERPFDIERIHSMVRTNLPDYRSRLYFRGELEKALSLFAEDGSYAPKTEMLKFKQMLNDISLHLSAQIRLTDIAAKYGWHPSAFSRAFKQAFGCPPKPYIDKLLVNRLRQELILTDKSLKQLAEEYAFCDAYYLSAFFKRLSGISPDAYRKSHA